MKMLLRMVAMVVVLALLAWAGAEFMLVRQARKAAAEGRIGLGGAEMLIDPARIGGRFAAVTLPLAGDRVLALSGLDLWVPALAWNIPHASLPAEARLTGPGGEQVLAFGDGRVQAQFSPLRDMSMVAADLLAQQARLNGQPLAGQVEIHARLTNYGAVVPAEVQAAYRIDGDISGLNLPLLARLLQFGEPSGERPGAADLQGPVTLWLSEVIGPRSADRPQLVGATFDGLRIDLDGAGLQIWGQLARDGSGMLNGELALDFLALRDFVAGLAHAGYLPPDYAQMVASALETIAHDAEKDAEPVLVAPVSSPNLIALRQNSGHPHIPARPEGVARVPLRFEGGDIFLGNLPLSALWQRGGAH